MIPKWKCIACGNVIESGAFLKICPDCEAIGTLVLEADDPRKRSPTEIADTQAQ